MFRGTAPSIVTDKADPYPFFFYRSRAGYGVGSLVTAAWNSGRYRPYPSASRRSTGMNRRAAEFMQ